MHPQGTPPARFQHRQVAGRLRVDYHPKAVLLSGNIQVVLVAACDLQKYPGIRAAFVVLPGGMQKARSKTEARRNMLLVAYLVTEFLNRCLMFSKHGQKRQRRKVIACM